MCPSRPDKSGRARISGHLGKSALIMHGFPVEFYKNELKELAYRSPRVFGDKFGETFGDKFGDSLNFVINMVTILVTHFVRHQICHNFW